MDELLTELRQSFLHRKFTPGLLLAMADFVLTLGIPSDDEVQSYDDLIRKYPREEVTAQGRPANQLIVKRGSSTIGLRPYYNEAEKLFRAIHHRFDYPNCAPHATQAWSGYIGWLDKLCRMDAEAIQILRNSVIEFVLAEFPDQSFVPGSISIAPPVFKLLLEGFSFVAPSREPSGAAYQGAVFGFIRADNPHLQVEIDKVRTGSRRLQRVGDIDGWDGERLAVTAEVKSKEMEEDDVADLVGFANQANRRGAIGLVVALSFSPEARTMISDLGVVPLDTDEVTSIVRLWDPSKQRIAVKSMVYYAAHVEKNSILLNRLKEFLDGVSHDWA